MKWLGRFALMLLVLAGGLWLAYQFYFLRLPDRNPPNDPTLFVSPANGVIAAVKPWGGSAVVVDKGIDQAIKVLTEELGDTGVLVSITLDLTNVHYQRAMIEGNYEWSEYHPGAFNNALQHDNDYGMRFENEHNVMFFRSLAGTPYKVVPIAGAAARRIDDFLFDEGPQEVEQGDVIGVIKLGSQVTVLFPAGVEVLVQPGDVVIDGESPFARDQDVPNAADAKTAVPEETEKQE